MAPTGLPLETRRAEPGAAPPPEAAPAQRAISGHRTAYAWSEAPPEGWEELSAAAGEKAFLRPSWFAAWHLAYGSSGNWSGSLRYLSASADGRLAAVLPLAGQTVLGARIASLGGYYLPFRSPVMVADPHLAAECLAAGLAELREVWSVRLGPVDEDSGEFAALASALRKREWRVVERAISKAFLIALPATGDEYEATLSAKRKKRLRYYWSRMCKAAETVLTHHNGIGHAEWRRIFGEIAAIEAASWISETGDPRFHGRDNQLFWSRLGEDPWMRSAMHAWIIHHGGKPVSFCFALDSGTTRYILANNYDRSVAEYSTGSKIYYEVIHDAIRRGLRTIDIGLGDSGYKARWGAKGEKRLVDAIAFPPNPKGRLIYLAASAKFRLADLAMRLRAARRASHVRPPSEEDAGPA